MPPAVIAAVAAIAAAATTTGVTLYEAANQPGTPKITNTPTPLTSSQNQATTASVGQQLPTLQSLTGGSVSPEYASQWGSTQTGVANNNQTPGDVQAAINTFYGLSAPGSSGLTTAPGGTTSGGNPILDLLSRASPTGGGGGTTSDLVSRLLSGDEFRGLAA